MGTGHHNVAEAMRPQSDGPSLRQLVFDLNTRDKNSVEELETEVTNILPTMH